MSDPNRPFGDTHDTDDPRREPTTDAPNDADALDAWLNEIASRSGSPGTRPNRPNARTGDAASVMDAAAAFHRRAETAQGRDSRASGPDPRLWETIMTRTSTSAMTAPLPGALPRAATPRGNPYNADLPPRLPATRQQHRWNMVANLGLVAAILLMAFGAWRLAGSPGLPGSGGNGSLPAGQFAMQPATPDGTSASTEIPAAVAPIATPTPTTACDFSKDIPIFEGVDESPWDGTAVLLTTSGDVMLTCPSEPQGDVLATTSGGASVSPLEWPGAVLVIDAGNDPENPRMRVVSLVTGDIVEFGNTGMQAEWSGTMAAPGSPWVIGPAPGDPADIQILDVRTMQTRLLSDIAGTALPTGSGWLLSTSSDGGTLVLGLLKSAYPTEGNATLVTGELPGDLLALHGSLDAVSWIGVPTDVTPVVDFKVSPDGRNLALHGASGSMAEREHTWSIMRLTDAAELARSSSFTTGSEGTEGVWTDHGLVYTDGSALMLLPIAGDGPAETVLDADGPLTKLRATVDSETVLVNQLGQNEMATSVAMSESRRVYAVKIASARESALFPGIDISDNVGWETPPGRFLVMFDYQAEAPETITYRVIDAITDETVGTLDDVPLDDSGTPGYPNLGLRSVVSSADGNTKVIAFDTQHIYLMTVVDGEPTVRQIASPEGLPSEYPLKASMFLSPDGSLLSLTAEGDEGRTRWLLPIDGEPDEWTTVENQTVGNDPGFIFFVPGTGD